MEGQQDRSANRAAQFPDLGIFKKNTIISDLVGPLLAARAAPQAPHRQDMGSRARGIMKVLRAPQAPPEEERCGNGQQTRRRRRQGTMEELLRRRRCQEQEH
eukprot:gene21035-biopygen14667